MRHLLPALTSALASFFLVPAFAQSSPAIPEDYILGADDILEVNVLNHPELNRTIVILPDGKITFPEVGELVAAGKTPTSLGQDIRRGLEKVRNNVDVSVLVKEIKSRRVRIVGAVRSQGSYALSRKLKLMDIISLAGGFTNKPNKVRGRLSRGTQTLLLDILKAIEDPSSSANLVIEPEDIILLDEVEPLFVYVAGQVERPGKYELDEKVSLLSILIQAGIKDDAAISQTHVTRGTEQIPLPGLREAVRAGKPTEELLRFQLKPGDQVFVPLRDVRYSVMGTVTKPGSYPVPESKDITALEALTLAGSGLPGQADLAKAGIIRLQQGQPTTIPINFDVMLGKRDLSQNHVLKPGDILYVPAKGARGFQWQDLLTPLTALSVLGFRIWR